MVVPFFERRCPTGGTRRGGSRGLRTPADTSLTFPSCLSSPRQWLSPCRAEQGDWFTAHFSHRGWVPLRSGPLDSAGKGSASSRRAVGSSPCLRGGALAVPSFPLPQHVEPTAPMPSAASSSFLSDPFSPSPQPSCTHAVCSWASALGYPPGSPPLLVPEQPGSRLPPASCRGGLGAAGGAGRRQRFWRAGVSGRAQSPGPPGPHASAAVRHQSSPPSGSQTEEGMAAVLTAEQPLACCSRGPGLNLYSDSRFL